MATERTTSRSGARRRTSILVAATLLLSTAGAIAATQESSAAGLPPHVSLHANRHVNTTSVRPVPANVDAPYLASHRGALLNNPGGAAWDFAEMRAAGFDWIALNVGDHELSDWSDVRERAEAAGLEVVPWARLCHPHIGETHQDCLRKLGALLDAAKALGTTRPIVNVETEIKPASLDGLITPGEVARELERAGMDEAAISTEAWLYDVSWVPLNGYAMLLQILPRDNRWAPEQVRAQQDACEERARGYGFDHVGTSVQSYPMADGTDAEPEWFDLGGTNRSVIWGDNVAAGEWQRWAGAR